MKKSNAIILCTCFRLKRVVIIRILSILALIAPYSLIEASGTKDNLPAAESAAREIAIYALSRGKGVPEPTRAALGKVRKLLDDAKRRGEVLKVTETRIGLEGEKRLCLEAKDVAAARTLLVELRVIAEGVELFNIVVEPCLKK
jgi:hypothetical protein